MLLRMSSVDHILLLLAVSLLSDDNTAMLGRSIKRTRQPLDERTLGSPFGTGPEREGAIRQSVSQYNFNEA